MDNLDKILPLILVLGAFIFNIVKNVKKEKEEKQRKYEAKKANGPTQMIPALEIKKTPRPEPVMADSNRKPIYKGYQGIYNPEDVEPVFSVFSLDDTMSEEATITGENKILSEDAEVYASPVFNLQDVNEAKRAIIYSEILGRKYE